MGYVGVFFDLFLPNEFSDRACVGVIEDGWVNFSFNFRWGPFFYKSEPSDHREVVRVRPPREGGGGGAYLLPSPRRSVGLGINPINSNVNYRVYS